MLLEVGSAVGGYNGGEDVMEGGGMDVSEGRIRRPTRFMTLPFDSAIGGPRDVM
jgi:hypothetical protein